MTSKFVQFSVLKDVSWAWGKWYQGWTSASMCACSVTPSVPLCANLWTFCGQAHLSTGFSRQEYWSGLLCPPVGDLSDPEINPFLSYPIALAGGFLTTSVTWEAQESVCSHKKIRVLEMVKIMRKFNFLLSFKVFKYNWLFKTKPWNNSLALNRERNTSRLYIVTLLIWIIRRVHHEKHWVGWSTRWNQDCWEKYQ